MSTCTHGQLARSCGTCELESENAALKAELSESARLHAMGSEREARLTARVAQLEQRLEINRAVLAGARNCILKYVPVSIQSDRDFTLGSIKLALDRGTE